MEILKDKCLLELMRYHHKIRKKFRKVLLSTKFYFRICKGRSVYNFLERSAKYHGI